jgi:VanZ family protein
LGVFGRTGAGHRHLRRASAAFVVGAAFIVLVEAAQVFIRSHAGDVNDVVFGLLGVAIGVFAGERVRTTPLAAEPSPIAVSAPGVLALAGWCLVLAVYHWRPYDFVVDPEAVRGKLARMSFVPFSGYRGAGLTAFNDLLVKLGLSIPLGLGAAFAIRVNVRRPAVTTGWLVFAAALFGLVESGQFFLPARVPDPTDVLLGLAGMYAGLVLGRWLQSLT